MKIYRIKSEDELKEIGYYDGYSIWKNKKIRTLRKMDGKNNPKLIEYAKELNRPVNDLRYPVIDCDDEIFGKIISNSNTSVPGILTFPGYDDKEFEIIFKWASECEITKDKFPEYFL